MQKRVLGLQLGMEAPPAPAPAAASKASELELALLSVAPSVGEQNRAAHSCDCLGKISLDLQTRLQPAAASFTSRLHPKQQRFVARQCDSLSSLLEAYRCRRCPLAASRATNSARHNTYEIEKYHMQCKSGQVCIGSCLQVENDEGRNI